MRTKGLLEGKVAAVTGGARIGEAIREGSPGSGRHEEGGER